MKDENIELFLESDDGTAESIRYTMGRNKVKYKLLDEYLTTKKYDQIHIDITKILKYVSIHCLKDLKSDTNLTYPIAAQICNLCAHYRHYFYKHRKSPDIFVYGEEEYDNKNVSNAFAMAKVIFRYIPHIYMIPVPHKEKASVYINYFKDGKSLIISKDLLNLQLLDGNTDMLLTNKDDSILYTSDNVYKKLISEDYDGNLSSKMIGPLMFFSGIGLDNKGVEKYGKSKTLKLFTKLTDSGILSNDGYGDSDDFVHDFKKYNDNLNLDNFEHNFNSYDVNHRTKKIISPSQIEILDNYIMPVKYSKTGLKELNSKYFFGLDSLDLDYLMEFNEK